MSLLYVPGSEDWTLGSAERSPEECAAWATSSGTPTLRPFSWHGWKARTWISRLSSTISQPSRAQATVDALTSYWRESLASRSAWPASAPGPTTPVGSGRPRGASSKKRARGRSSSKTSAASTPLDSDPFSAILPKQGGLRSGEIFARPTSARPTAETAYSLSLWPTATATDSKASGAAGYSTDSGRHSGTTLTDAAVRLAEWPTPTAQTYGNNRGGAAGRVGPVRHSLDSLGRQWATPTARDWRSEVATQSPAHSPPLGRQVLRMQTDGENGSTQADQPRQLCVRFVELLMGFPIGWSDSGPIDSER